MSILYPWIRFWCPMDKEWNLSDNGFLFDPYSEYGKIYNPDVFPIEYTDSNHCVVMLGEQGIGKSEELKASYERIKRQTDASESACIYVNLGQCVSRADLNADIFGSTIYKEWLEGKVKYLYLFLDSLDEGILHFGAITGLIMQEFQKCPQERLYLRITCRSGYWRRKYEDELNKIWDPEIFGLKIIKLAPLRSTDVKLAVKLNGIDAGGFFKELYSKKAIPFAIKPVTLEMLIRKYAIDGKLPKTQEELYYRGCLLLSEERDDSKAHDAQLSRRERVSIAARIAAMCIFSQKPLILMDNSSEETSEAALSLEAICRGYEVAEERQVAVRINNVREVLATGLFMNSGPDTISWAHQSYSEFLAAKYLIDNGINKSRILNLITCFEERGRRIIPQLSAVAAWLATMSEEIFKALIKINPEILLDSEITTTDDEMREALVESHLTALKSSEITPIFGKRCKYKNLNYVGIESKLSAYILDKKIDSTVRSEAIKIAEECEIVSLSPIIVNAALSNDEQLNVRIAAAAAIASIGDQDAKLSLRPLLGIDDPMDELKGHALEAIWSIQKSIDSILGSLTPPKRNNYLGSYYFFLAYNLAKTVEIYDIPKLLDWVTEQRINDQEEGNYAYKELFEKLFCRAWLNTNIKSVLESLVRAVWKTAKNYDVILKTNGTLEWEEDKDKVIDDQIRYLVLKRLIESTEYDPQESHCLSNSGLINGRDFQWLLKQVNTDKKHEDIWVKLINLVVDSTSPEQLKFIFDTFRDTRYASTEFAWLFQAVLLNSKQAEMARKHYHQRIEWESKRNRKVEPPPEERIEILLQRIEAGQIDSWWQLNRDMTLEIDDPYYRKEFEADLTDTPGWKGATPATKARILSAAKAYLLNGDCAPKKWLGKDIFFRPAAAGYRAILLLMKEDPEFLATIPAERWAHWAPIITAYPVSSFNEAEETLHELTIEYAWEKASRQVIDTLLVLIDKENRESENLFILRRFKHIKAKTLFPVLLEKAKDPELKSKIIAAIIEFLLEHEMDEARVYAEALLFIIPANEDEEKRSVLIAATLVSHCARQSWSLIWQKMQSNSDFAKALAFEIAQKERYHGNLLSSLTEEQAADLYIWLCKRFPYSDDPDYDDAHWVGPRESVGDFRNQILEFLKLQGCSAAIKYIAEHLPELDWIKKYTLPLARNKQSSNSWVPLAPATILEIVQNPRKVLIKSGEELLEVLIDLLHDFQTSLQGETPMSILLWNQEKIGNSSNFTPKEENVLSDFLKWYLDLRLKKQSLFIGREVEIYRGPGKPMGKRTDIYIKTSVRDEHGEGMDITAIIEVKGCWNESLDRAMKTQLRDDYLKNSGHRYGLYVIGWFDCGYWQGKNALGMDYSKAVTHFAEQAEEASDTERTIKSFVLDAALR